MNRCDTFRGTASERDEFDLRIKVAQVLRVAGDDDLVAGVDEPARHPAAYRAETDEGDGGHGTIMPQGARLAPGYARAAFVLTAHGRQRRCQRGAPTGGPG